MAVILLLVSPKAKWLSVVAGIVAGLVVIFEGWILSMSAGSPLWSGGIMPAIFLVEGLLLALGVISHCQACLRCRFAAEHAGTPAGLVPAQRV